LNGLSPVFSGHSFLVVQFELQQQYSHAMTCYDMLHRSLCVPVTTHARFHEEAIMPQNVLIMSQD